MKQTNVVNIHHNVAYDVYIGRARKSDAPNIVTGKQIGRAHV